MFEEDEDWNEFNDVNNGVITLEDYEGTSKGFKIKNDYGIWQKIEYSCQYNVNTGETQIMAWKP